MLSVYLRLDDAHDFAVSFSATVPGASLVVAHRTFISLEIGFRQSHIGRYEDRLEIVLEDVSLKKQFIIAKPLRAIVGNSADHELLKPKAPFVPRPRTKRQEETDVVEGVPPTALNAVPYLGRLPRAVMPGPLFTDLSSGSFSDILGRVRRVYLPGALDSNTYGRYFKHLLWIEEFRMESVFT